MSQMFVENTSRLGVDKYLQADGTEDTLENPFEGAYQLRWFYFYRSLLLMPDSGLSPTLLFLHFVCVPP